MGKNSSEGFIFILQFHTRKHTALVYYFCTEFVIVGQVAAICLVFVNCAVHIISRFFLLKNWILIMSGFVNYENFK
jgi:hypothetical protein